MNKLVIPSLLTLPVWLALACGQQPKAPAGASASDSLGYTFIGGYPTEATIQKAYDDADLNRAIQAYRFFYPTVSGAAILKGNRDVGIIPNKVFGRLDTKPIHVGFTLNSDTPYGPIMLDLSNGPYVIELPPGPLIVAALDVNQVWVADMGIPGPDAGKGGKHLIVPPGFTGNMPAGHHVWKTTSNQITVGARSLPVNGDVQAAMERIATIKVYPLNAPAEATGITWPDLTGKPQDTTPLKWETNLQFWEILHKIINEDAVVERYKLYYGELAVLDIAKGKPFNPDARMKGILEKAAVLGNGQMRVQSFADRRPDRVVWPDRKWEWAALRFENADFATPNYIDLDAREVWFFQAIGTSPAMFRRQAGGGSLYWLGLRDKTGTYLEGGRSYKLSVPQPVPAKLFWSVTVYDAETRSQVQTDQNKAALRSLFELKDLPANAPAELFSVPRHRQGRKASG